MTGRDETDNLARKLSRLIADGEDWLMGRILKYAKARGYAKYTSTLQEAWRLSISGLSDSLCNALCQADEAFELGPDMDFVQDSVAAFGIVEARRHKERGVDLGMFLALMKYYRQSYADLVATSDLPSEARDWGQHRIKRFFDRIEIGFCIAWADEGASEALQSLQAANRRMANEKNKYLTFFESMPQPAFLVDRNGAVANMNQAAARLFEAAPGPGAHYYRNTSESGHETSEENKKVHVVQLFPWLGTDFEQFMNGSHQTRQETRKVASKSGLRHFYLRFSKMLDVSGKFIGAVIIAEDITEQKAAEHERLRREKLEGTLEVAGAVCHELNQPIMAVSGYSELALMSVDPDHELYDKVKKINEQVQRMGEITRKLMKITRYRSKRYADGERILDIEKSSKEN